MTIPPPPPPVLTDPTERQISPQIAAVLLSTPRPELTVPSVQIVDAVKAGCPGYAVMRSLMMGFRRCSNSPQRRRRRGPDPHRHGVAPLDGPREGQRHCRDPDLRVAIQGTFRVEATVTERWSKGPVEGQVNRLKTIKRQMYGRAGVELLRARLIPLSVEPILLQRE